MFSDIEISGGRHGLIHATIKEEVDNNIAICFAFENSEALNVAHKRLQTKLSRRFGADKFNDYFLAINPNLLFLQSKNKGLLLHFISTVTEGDYEMLGEILTRLRLVGYGFESDYHYFRIPTWDSAQNQFTNTIQFIKKSALLDISTHQSTRDGRQFEIRINCVSFNLMGSLRQKLHERFLSNYFAIISNDNELILSDFFVQQERDRQFYERHHSQFHEEFSPYNYSLLINDGWRGAPRNKDSAMMELIKVLYEFEPMFQNSDVLFREFLHSINALNIPGIQTYSLRNFSELLDQSYLRRIVGENASHERLTALSPLFADLRARDLERRLARFEPTQHPVLSSFKAIEEKPGPVQANFEVEDYTCTITLELMDDPVNFPQCENKTSFERNAIVQYFGYSDTATHPLSREQIKKSWITSNIELKKEIEAYKRGEIVHPPKAAPAKIEEPPKPAPVIEVAEEPAPPVNTLVVVKKKKKCVIL